MAAANASVAVEQQERPALDEAAQVFDAGPTVSAVPRASLRHVDERFGGEGGVLKPNQPRWTRRDSARARGEDVLRRRVSLGPVSLGLELHEAHPRRCRATGDARRRAR